MVERGRGPRLSKESVGQPLGGVHDLDGDGTVQTRVEGAEHLAHAAFANARVEAIVAEGRQFHVWDARMLADSALYSAPCRSLSSHGGRCWRTSTAPSMA